MGLFHKQKPKDDASLSDEAIAIEQHFFDENFREELRNHGRWYFEKVISENAKDFKQELDATVTTLNTELREALNQQLDDTIVQVNADLKAYAIEQLNTRFEEYGREMRDAQESTIQSLNRSAQAMQDKQLQLSASLEESIKNQEAVLKSASDENAARIEAMKSAQDLGLQSLNKSAQAMEEQYEELTTMLQKNVAKQEELLINVFQENMARIVEQYLLGALGDQYDLKAQLPSIIKQMEEKKQAIVDDMKL